MVYLIVNLLLELVMRLFVKEGGNEVSEWKEKEKRVNWNLPVTSIILVSDSVVEVESKTP